VGENANHESQIRFNDVLAPTVILIVSFVTWRFVGLTEIWAELEEKSNPLIKTLMTGFSDGAKAELILAYARAQLHDPEV
jgi:hypothetical protein